MLDQRPRTHPDQRFLTQPEAKPDHRFLLAEFNRSRAIEENERVRQAQMRGFMGMPF